MKQPLIVLAVCTITTFTMGWFGHRVFSKSMSPDTQQSILPQPIMKTDTIAVILKDTLLAKLPDTISPKITAPDNISAKPTIMYASSTTDTLWNDSKEIIIRMPNGSIDIKRRFNPGKTFKDFATTEKFKGKASKELNFSTCKYGNLYKTATKKALLSGATFAGRFAFVIIECGTGCFSSTIVDLKTGKVYDGPHASSGYQFKLNSRLLIINPPQADGFYTPCDYCEPEAFVWTGKEFKKVRSY